MNSKESIKELADKALSLIEGVDYAKKDAIFHIEEAIEHLSAAIFRLNK